MRLPHLGLLLDTPLAQLGFSSFWVQTLLLIYLA